MAATRDSDTRQYTEADYTDFAHTGPGTLAGRYLRLFWQPVHLARDLPAGHAKPIRIMGEDFTLYRGEDGTPHVVAPRCAHRGTQLSTGWVEGDCLCCFYHGWKYDHTGQCVEMPAEDASFPPKVRIASYPTEEYLGLIFAYLGDEDAPPLPRFAELEAEGLLLTDTYVRACNYFQSLENTPDEVHLNFVHRQSAFTEHGLNWDIPRIEAEETEYGMVQHGIRGGGVVRQTPFQMPNYRLIKSPPEDPDEAGWREFVSWRVPLNDERFQSFNVTLVHATGALAERIQARIAEREATRQAGPSVDELARAVLRGELRIDDLKDHPNVVNIQDSVSQMGQGPIANRAQERLGRSDTGVILLRKLWERELRALAEGRPLTPWRRTARVEATSGV
jgi:5,5'-dehydrodivanillate O-demethylase